MRFLLSRGSCRWHHLPFLLQALHSSRFMRYFVSKGSGGWHHPHPLAPLCLAAAVAAKKFRIRGMSIDNPSKPPFEKGSLVKGKPLIITFFNGAGELWWSPDDRLPSTDNEAYKTYKTYKTHRPYMPYKSHKPLMALRTLRTLRTLGKLPFLPSLSHPSHPSTEAQQTSPELRSPSPNLGEGKGQRGRKG